MSTKILQEAADLLTTDACTRVVELSASYDAHAGATQKFVRLKSYAVQFVRLSEGGKTRRFTLSQQEANDFVAAWGQYQLDHAEAVAAEQMAQQQARDDAFAIAAEIPAIQIHDENDGSRWWVEIAAIKWHSRGPLLEHGRELLAAVQAARGKWAEHILFLRESLANERWEPDAGEQAARTVEQYSHLIPYATDESGALVDHPF